MRATDKISILLLPIVFAACEMLAQGSSPALPNSPAAQSFFVASAQSPPTGASTTPPRWKVVQPYLHGKKLRRSRWQTTPVFASAN